ncbi:MAG: universal stress protein [Caldilineaceae bacterium]|nr:universal stress protein [Caldilineaceae bacterium]
MTKHVVLVPNDGSEFCRQIYPHLMKLCHPEETRIILLRVGEPPEGHVATPPRPAGYDSGLTMYASHGDATMALHPIYASQEWESAVAEIQSELMVDLHRLEAAGYDVEIEVRFGDRGEEIVKFVENNDVDLIAMTTHWRTGIQKLIFGSVAQYVAGHASVPVLMVHPQHA